MKLETYNTEAFKALREEIRLRIDTHYKLVLTKFSGVGALFAFFGSSLNVTPLSPYVACAIFGSSRVSYGRNLIVQPLFCKFPRRRT
jgi:hypothetical protein